MDPQDPGPRFVWRVTDEFRNRLGCGVLAAVGLPLWFGMMALGLSGDSSAVGAVVAFGLFAVALVVGVLALRRFRELPTEISIDGGGWMSLRSRRGETVFPASDVRRVEVGHSPGLSSVRLHLGGRQVVRLSGDLEDLDGFLVAIQTANPDVELIDQRAAGPATP